MNNYQLTKTNILLGGQMQWNLQVKNNKNNNLKITDFFLSPISKWISFTKPDRDSLNYTHEENIKDLYNTIEADFYELKLDPRLQTKMPIITEQPSKVDSYCDMYDMGVSRTSVARSGKTMQIFCPLWLEDFKPDDVIEFDISIFTKQKIYIDGNEELHKDMEINKKLSLSFMNNCDYHNKFLKYFNNYINNIIETTGIIGDKIININLDNLYMVIEGIDIKTGKKVNKNISYSLPNIISSFRPMMDTDSLIINNLSNNNVICKQLFNFNLLFNLEDILSHHIIKQLSGKPIYMEITTKIIRDDKINTLPIKSFSFNYDDNFKIPKINSLNNTLDFFKDYNYIHLLDKNKLAPNIIHWSSTDDNDYIFNIYPDATWNTNLWGTNVNNDNLCLHWCNNDLMLPSDSKDKEYGNVKDWGLLRKVIDNSINKYSEFKSRDKFFTNNVFYDSSSELSNSQSESIFLYINIIDDLIDGGKIADLTNKLPKIKIPIEGKTQTIGYIYEKDGATNYFNILIDRKFINELSFKNMISKNAKYIDEIFTDKNWKLSEILNSHKPSKIIPIRNSIVQTPIEYPVISNKKSDVAKEINYGKIYIPEHYLFRQDGHIKPTFVNFEDNNYYMIKKLKSNVYNDSNISNDDNIYNDTWDKFIKSKFPALYPSIKYFYLDKIIGSNDYDIERRWYNDSYVYVLANNISFDIIKDTKVNTQSIKDNIKSMLKSYYNINDEYLTDYIYNLYNYDIKFEYLLKNDINKYKYTVNVKLK